MKFVDTGWWIAWVLPDDARHTAAAHAAAGLGTTEQMLTTNHVIGESWTFLRKKTHHDRAVTFLDRVTTLVTARKLQIHHVTDAEEAAAWRWLRRHDERIYSFVDATSFEVMRRRRLREAWAFDHDFAAAGFIEIRE